MAVPEVIDSNEYLTAIRAGLESGGPGSLAAYPPAGGHVGLRELIAQRLSANRGFDASPDNVFISDGAGGAITILLDSFINPGDPVLVEEFTYMGSLRMMLERGADPVHVACDEDGMLPDALEESLRSLENAGRRAKFVWLIPVYQNPLGFSSSLQRRRALLEIAQSHAIPVLENESYADFRIDGDPLPTAFSGLSDQGDVFYVSSFTKLLGCGLRVGFGVLPPGVREALPQVNAENPPSPRGQPLGHHDGLRIHARTRGRTHPEREERFAGPSRRHAGCVAGKFPLVLRMDSSPGRDAGVCPPAGRCRYLVYPRQGHRGATSNTTPAAFSGRTADETIICGSPTATTLRRRFAKVSRAWRNCSAKRDTSKASAPGRVSPSGAPVLVLQ